MQQKGIGEDTLQLVLNPCDKVRFESCFLLPLGLLCMAIMVEGYTTVSTPVSRQSMGDSFQQKLGECELALGVHGGMVSLMGVIQDGNCTLI